ncbi:MAG: transposase, partial [Eggerthellaceae bacterium]|nr:transposase [Eggerthellaceae bacterium]
TRGTLKGDVCRESLGGRIGRGATVATDDHHAYSCLSEMGANHRVCISTVPEGDINRANTLHSALKGFFAAKRGVSSRRLHLYLSEFAWRWASTRSDERTADTAKRVISQIARTEARGIGSALDGDGYPFVEFWHSQQGQDEKRRMLLASRQFVINRDMRKHAGDAEKEAEIRMRQRKLDLDIAASGLKPSGIGKGVYDNHAVADLSPCTASTLRAGRRPNVGAVRKYMM